jgi:hypothetical protein
MDIKGDAINSAYSAYLALKEAAFVDREMFDKIVNL